MLEQGVRNDEEYVLHVKALSAVLGEPFGMVLASKFIQGIRDPIIKKVVHCQLDDRYNLGQAIKAFRRATRDERAILAQQQQVKEASSEFNFAQALLTSQENMAKMMESNQKVMMETNQRMVEFVTKVVGQPRGTNLPQINN